MNAQARYTDPSARSFTTRAIWLAVGAFLVAGVIAGLAWANRDVAKAGRTRHRRRLNPTRGQPWAALLSGPWLRSTLNGLGGRVREEQKGDGR